MAEGREGQPSSLSIICWELECSLKRLLCGLHTGIELKMVQEKIINNTRIKSQEGVYIC